MTTGSNLQLSLGHPLKGCDHSIESIKTFRLIELPTNRVHPKSIRVATP